MVKMSVLMKIQDCSDAPVGVWRKQIYNCEHFPYRFPWQTSLLPDPMLPAGLIWKHRWVERLCSEATLGNLETGSPQSGNTLEMEDTGVQTWQDNPPGKPAWFARGSAGA